MSRRASELAIHLAHERARALVEGMGMPAHAAASLAARRLGLRAPLGEVRRGLRDPSRVWRSGSLARPTARPTRTRTEDAAA